MKEKFVIVPQADIDRIEEARKNLWKLHDIVNEKIPNRNQFSDTAMQVNFNTVSQPMWEISHRRYEVKKSIWDKVVDIFRDL